MLNDWSDRDPEPRPPGWRDALLIAVTAIGVALAVNIVRGLMDMGWNW